MSDFLMASSSTSDVEDGDPDVSLVAPPSPDRSQSRLLWQVSGAVSAAFGGLLMGLTLAYTSTALPSMQADPEAPALTPAEGSLIGAAVPLGALAGGLSAGPLSRRVGQRAVMVFSCLPSVAGWLMIAYAGAAASIVVGRVLTGCVAGASSAIITGFISETVSGHVRGALGASFQLMVTLGVLLSYLAGRWLAWRWLATLGALLAPSWALAMALLATDSPVWLVSRHRVVDADRALRRLRGSAADISSELALISQRVESSRSSSAWLRLGGRQHRRPLIMVLVLMFLQQLSGVNVVIFYTKQIFEWAGSSLSPGSATVLVGAVQVVATLVSVVLVDRAGRRALLIASDLVMGACLLALGAFFWLKTSGSDVSSLHWLPLVALLLFICAFSVGFGPIPWLMLGELFAPEVQGVASGLATAFNWGLAFMVTLLFSPVSSAIGLAATFWLFAAVCLLGAVYVARQVVETRGRSLHEISQLFHR